jgi:hypothetical protein
VEPPQDDKVEGRGPMVPVAAFSDEDTAWIVADTIGGPMGIGPRSGSWRTEKYRDVTVEPTYVYASLFEYDPRLTIQQK